MFTVATKSGYIAYACFTEAPYNENHQGAGIWGGGSEREGGGEGSRGGGV